MLDDYLQKIEALISPNHYSRENFREKIIESSKNQSDNLYYQLSPKLNDINEEDQLKSQNIRESFEHLMNTNQKEQIIKLKKENEGKLEIPEEIIINHQESDTIENNIERARTLSPTCRMLKSKKDYSEKDVKLLFEKIHNLNLKNMNYRYEIEKYKTKINELTKEKNEYKTEIDKLEHQKDNLTKYLLRLEENISNNQRNSIESNQISKINSKRSSVNNNKQSQNINNINISLNKSNNNSEILTTKKSLSIFNSQTISIDVSPNNIVSIIDTSNQKTLTLSTRRELKNFLLKIYNENKKLKIFQNQVFELSKTYDDINDNLLESIRNIQGIVESREEGIDIEKDLVSNYQKLVENVDKTLQTKQKEYNMLLQGKEEENQFIQDELVELSAEVQIRKKDRIKDQQMISELEQENKELKEKIFAYEEYKNNIKKNNDSYKQCITIEKRIEPAKKTLGQIMKKIENNFDLNDQGNVNMLGTIHSTLK